MRAVELFEIINRLTGGEFLHCGQTSGRLPKLIEQCAARWRCPYGSTVNYWISVIKSCAAADSSGVPGDGGVSWGGCGAGRCMPAWYLVQVCCCYNHNERLRRQKSELVDLDAQARADDFLRSTLALPQCLKQLQLQRSDLFQSDSIQSRKCRVRQSSRRLRQAQRAPIDCAIKPCSGLIFQRCCNFCTVWFALVCACD